MKSKILICVLFVSIVFVVTLFALRTPATVIEMEMTSSYDDADPFINEKLIYSSEDSIDFDVSFRMVAESGLLEIADNETKHVIFNKPWEGTVDDKFNFSLNELKKEHEYVIRLTCTKVESAKLVIKTKNTLVKEIEKPLKPDRDTALISFDWSSIGEVVTSSTPAPYEIHHFTDRTDTIHEGLTPTKVAFIVTTEQGAYHFSDEKMPLETVHEYIDRVEAGIKLANDWFGQSGILDLYIIQRDFATEYPDLPGYTISGGGGDGKAWFEYDYSYQTPPDPFVASHVLMHEAVHAMCDMHSETTNFPKRPEPHPLFWLDLIEEGLATMLEHLYGNSAGRLHDVYMYHYESIHSRQQDNNSFEDPLAEVNDVAQALDHLALLSLKHDEFYDDVPYDILRSYYTSASFLYYLYDHHDNGSKENVRRVYADISLMEEVFGKDIDGMLDEWLLYLEQF